jgi:hypothetical protein
MEIQMMLRGRKTAEESAVETVFGGVCVSTIRESLRRGD